MMYKYFNKYLDNNEVILKVIYQAKFFLFLKLFFLLLVFLLDFFLMIPIFNLGRWGIVFFFLILLFCVFSAIRIYRQSLYNALVITDNYIHSFYHNGILDRVVEEFKMDNIQKIEIIYLNWFLSFLKIGDISIFLKNENELIFENITSPQRLKRYIQELVI
ncbi:hypothetical protein K8R66_00695 [bacterium]|nr:hypothetical protein [bacterium]